MKIHAFLTYVFLLCSVTISTAQEFNCSCTVNAPALQKNDPKVIKDLEQRIDDFFNKNVWTNDRFEQEERINCNVALNITSEGDNNDFTADLIISTTRPIFNSNYESPAFSIQDRNVAFVFQEFQPLVFSENNFIDNLSSILQYYGYIMLAMDYDSFSPYGGEKYIAEAQNVVNAVPQQLQSASWGLITDNNINRVTLVESLLSARIRTLRKAYYDYHRLGLDVMAEDADGGRQTILNSLGVFKEVSAKIQDNPYIRVFASTKTSEVISVFSIANRNQKLAAYDAMVKIDPANASVYNVIKR